MQREVVGCAPRTDEPQFGHTEDCWLDKQFNAGKRAGEAEERRRASRATRRTLQLSLKKHLGAAGLSGLLFLMLLAAMSADGTLPLPASLATEHLRAWVDSEQFRSAVRLIGLGMFFALSLHQGRKVACRTLQIRSLNQKIAERG